MSFCKYRYFFGVEKQGLHSVRVFDIAVIDLLLTLLVGSIISYFTKLNVILLWIILLLLGIVLHRLFCVNTTINKIFFGEIN